MAARTSGKKQKKQKAKISYTRKPDNLTDFEWQSALRKQIAGDEKFSITKPATGGVYDDYYVHSNQSNRTYKVALRSADNSLNFCSCPDFKINQLGTCKHVEAVLLKVNAKPVTRKALLQRHFPAYTSIYLNYVGERKVKIRIGSEKNAAFKKLAKEYFSASGELSKTGFENFDKFLAKARQIDDSFRCYDDALEFVLQQRAYSHRKAIVEKQGLKLLEKTNKATLFPYQQQGVLFAVTAGRCILADDMGLGKTLQAIMAVEVMRKHFHISKVVIVCPTSLKYQWKNEIEKFVGNKKITVVEGNLLSRMRQYAEKETEYLIVSYNVAGNDYEYLNELQADILILDEAQRIKNWRTKISARIKRIETDYAYVLTGTPVENKIEELYSLMQIVNPYLLGSLHHFLNRHQVTDDTGKVTGYTNLNAIGELLQHVMLRRTKKEVLKQLPSRMDKNLVIPITEEQMQLHTEYGDAVARLVKKWKNIGFLKEEDRQRLLNLLSQMRMVCDSTYIIDQTTNYQTKLDELRNILEGIISMEGEKVVIFSQWERMTRLVAAELQEKEIGFKYLHGGVPSKDREELFTSFNNDINCRVFLSTDAGGVGLNLQSAAYLVNLDIPWNPAVLEQRIGRIYRLGQKKNVNIINLVAKDTIEERMLSVLKFKKAIADGILDGGDNDIFMGEDKMKKFMASVESVVNVDTAPAEQHTVNEEELREEKNIELPQAATAAAVEMPEETMAETSLTVATNEPAHPNNGKKVIEQGVSFFESFLQAVNAPGGIQQITEQLIDTDEKTGKSYIKIPVSNSAVVENALTMLGSFLKGLK